MYIDINTDAVVKFTAKLERMSKSALPVAVRSALNSAAFDVKKKTMPEGAKQTFKERKPTFFKSNSKVEQANGFNIAQMKATVGFVSKGGKDNAVEDLEQQENGGTIGGRSYIPLKNARTGTSWLKNVKTNARISDLKGKVVDSRKAKGKNKKQQFIKSAIHAGKGGFVLGDRKTQAGNKILFQVRSIKRIGGKTVIKSIPLFAVKKGRKVQPKPTHFMKNASLKSGNKLEQFYIEQAKKQIDKF